MSVRGKPSEARRGQLSGDARHQAGVIVTLVRPRDGRIRVVHVGNIAVADGLRLVIAQWIDGAAEEWKIRTISTPTSILGDLTAPRAILPEHTYLGVIKRRDVYEGAL